LVRRVAHQTTPIGQSTGQPFGYLPGPLPSPTYRPAERLVSPDRYEAFAFDSAAKGARMFATIKNLIPEPRQADQPRRYTGRHRRPEPVIATAPVSPAPIAAGPIAAEPDEKAETAETAAA
jgi:hypothetical protein